MPVHEPTAWSDLLRRQLHRYDQALLRKVAARLVRPRNQWPAEELIDRSLAIVENAAVIDRRLKDLEPASRQVLALIGRSRQPRWGLGNLVEMVIALGHADGLAPIFALFEAGLLYPELPGRTSLLKSFEQWLGQDANTGLRVFAHPLVTDRALGEDLGLPDLASAAKVAANIHEADGLELPLRLAAIWQQVTAAPLRRTQQGDFFKRDHERLQNDAILNGAPADALTELPGLAFLTVALAEAEGILKPTDAELTAVALPAHWDQGLTQTLAALWTSLLEVRLWNAQDGYRRDLASNPFPSAYLLTLLLLARMPPETWARPADLEDWLWEHHPYWQGEDLRPSMRRPWLTTFLLGLAYPLRLIQAAKGPDQEWLVRLSPLGRWLMRGGEAPAAPASFPQTLLVQPNLEIIAYRQGLTPAVIAQLSRFADWQNLGAACMLQLRPEAVYRALEAGETFETIRRTLERHGMRGLPPAVIDSLRTWSNKRERIAVFPSATLFEFSSAEDLNEALARGLPATRVSERMAVVASESEVDFRHFRLTGARDYSLPPEMCVAVDPDGVTLDLDLAKSDLLVESELLRFAEPLDRPSSNGRRLFKLTPASLSKARERGLSLQSLDEWFQQRSGEALSAAGRMLLTAAQMPAVHVRRQVVLHVPTDEIADGLMQWPGTQALIEARLGPTTLAVREEHLAALEERLRDVGLRS